MLASLVNQVCQRQSFTKTNLQGPHTLQKPKERPGIMPDVLHAIGNTPLVRINRIAQSAGLKCEMCKLKHNWMP